MIIKNYGIIPYIKPRFHTEEIEPLRCNCEVDGISKSYWDNITAMYNKQREKGLATYGMTLEENTDLTVEERITMLQEELIDGLVYMEHIKQGLKSDQNTTK